MSWSRADDGGCNAKADEGHGDGGVRVARVGEETDVVWGLWGMSVVKDSGCSVTVWR